MRISQAGNNRFAGKINRARSMKVLRVGVRTDKNDALVFHRDGFGVRLLFINGVNISVKK